jgi:hypothetical protein
MDNIRRARPSFPPRFPKRAGCRMEEGEAREEGREGGLASTYFGFAYWDLPSYLEKYGRAGRI